MVFEVIRKGTALLLRAQLRRPTPAPPPTIYAAIAAMATAADTAIAASEPPPASSWVSTLVGVLWESRRIVAAHTRHFLAISVLFLLPLSLILVASYSLSPSILRPSTALPPHETLVRLAPLPSAARAVGILVLSAIASALLALCAAAAVSRSVQDGFFGRPVRLATALRSLPSSLWRLLLTSFATALLFAAYSAILVSLFLLCLRLLPLLGLRRQHFFTPIFATGAAVMALVTVCLQVNWALAGVVAVSELSWGFEPLWRSARLVRGMRYGVLCLVLFFSAGIGLVLWCSDLGSAVEVDDWYGAIPVVVRVVCASAMTMVLLLYSLVCTTVLYIYCKALHGELAGEIAEEFAREYVCLPFDERKVPHIISVVRQ